MSYEYPQVSKIVRHPQFDAKRLSDDIAVMITTRVIGENLSVSVFLWFSTKMLLIFFLTPLFSSPDLQHPYVSPACFPSCQQQFDYVFSNGTGARFCNIIL